MLLKKSRVLVISKVVVGGDLMLVNDLALSFGDWMKNHPKHVAEQIIEIEQALYDELVAIRKGAAVCVEAAVHPEVKPAAPKVAASAVPEKKK